MQKRILSLMLVLALVMSLTACGKPSNTQQGNGSTSPAVSSPSLSPPISSSDSRGQEPSSSENPVIDVNTVVGNTSGNLARNGWAAYQDDWIYYGATSMSDDVGLYKCKTDGTGKELIISHNPRNINVIGEWIYYGNVNEQNKVDPKEVGLYKIKTDGTSLQQLYPRAPYRSTVVGNWIYFADNGIEKINTDGTDYQVVVNDLIADFTVVNDWIYYVMTYKDNRPDEIYKVKTDGTGKQLLHSDGRIVNIVVQGDWIFYANNSKNTHYKLRIDGTDSMEMPSYTELRVSGDWMFYKKDYDWYRIKSDGTNEQVVLPDARYTSILGIFNDLILYGMKQQSENNIFKCYIINTDGTNNRPVE